MSHVRELPPLRLHIEAVTPTGRFYRWGDDEPNPANIPSGLSFSSTMPGGYEQLDVSLARKAGVDYSDLQRLSTLRARGAGGDIAWEGRLERTPRVSGDQMAIAPSAVGWQAHLEDDKSAHEVYVDRDLNNWTRGASVGRRLLFPLYTFADATVEPDTTNGQPALRTTIGGAYTTASKPATEGWYEATVPLGSLYYAWKKSANVSSSDVLWFWQANLADGDGNPTLDTSANLRAAGPGTGTLTATAANRFFAFVQQRYDATSSSAVDNVNFDVFWTCLAVYGRHGLTTYGPADATNAQGVLASDVITHAIGRWAPLLVIDGTVQASSFVVPHLTFPELTTAGEIVRQATSFGLQDWGVWDNRTFYWAQRGTYGRKWRARIAPAQLSETGPQLDRVWESIVVSYTDVDGTTRTVGPPGSGADVEDAVLHDTDPDNPANQLGIIRRDLLSAGTTTAAGAIEIGRRFLEEQKLLDTSGQARLVGHVMDDRGALHPYWRIRAGDQISFIDASDLSYRRIVRASHDHGSRTCTVDLDAPPEGLEALLARLGVVLVPLGIAA